MNNTFAHPVEGLPVPTEMKSRYHLEIGDYVNIDRSFYPTCLKTWAWSDGKTAKRCWRWRRVEKEFRIDPDHCRHAEIVGIYNDPILGKKYVIFFYLHPTWSGTFARVSPSIVSHRLP